MVRKLPEPYAEHGIGRSEFDERTKEARSRGRFEGKVAIVTGAAIGIGKEMTCLAREGAHVANRRSELAGRRGAQLAAARAQGGPAGQ